MRQSSSSSLVLGGCRSFITRITTSSSSSLSSSASKTIGTSVSSLQRKKKKKKDELQEDFYVRLLLLHDDDHETSSSSSSSSFSGGNINSISSFNSLKQIHSHLFTSGFIRKSSPHLVAKIIIKYAKFGEIQSARSFFDGNIINTGSNNNSFLWNTMLRAYANGGHSRETLELYLLMRTTTTTTGNNYTFPFVLKSCASRASSSALEGKLIHGDVIRAGFGSCMFVEAALVDMYAKCGETHDARRVFDGMSKRDLVCWMIVPYFVPRI